ncbi:MAG: AAA family ATPase [Micrococcus sp.]|nr:AAA family ATPase [Micrococcus sp.]
MTAEFTIPRPLDTGRQFEDGGEFIFNTPDMPTAVWGQGHDVLWAEGEALMIYGGSGVGKSTIAGQLVRALILADGDVLGHPVAPATGRVLYLAMDRPRQLARSLRRQFHPAHRGEVSSRLVIWQGPPPEDLAENTGLLAQMCREAGASHVFVDSLKDAAVGLSDDKVGAGYNRARQAALSDGVQVAELHHQVKQRADGPKGIDAVYGSTWLTAGVGSVIHLDGAPGDAVVKLRHLKQPADTVGPFDVIHDPDTGL